MTDREAFGLNLRRARERRGLTLEQVCERTKVGVAHFSGLERGDLSRWPSGIFRRAFIRSYAAAVGLDPEALVAEFGRIFPDPADGQRPVSKADRAAKEPGRPAKQAEPVADETPAEDAAESSKLRLVLDSSTSVERFPRAGAAARRVLAGAIDVLLPLVTAGLAAWIAGRGWFWITAASVGLIGHIGFFGFTGSTPGSWLLRLPRGNEPAARSESSARRRPDPETAVGGRRHVSRLPTTRPAGHAHRVRH